jgi:hypothetical protein
MTRISPEAAIPLPTSLRGTGRRFVLFVNRSVADLCTSRNVLKFIPLTSLLSSVDFTAIAVHEWNLMCTAFQRERGVNFLKDINRLLLEAFKVWRTRRILTRKFARGASSVALDVAVLHKVFAFADDAEMILKNPVKMEGRPGEKPTHGAQPYRGDELRKLRLHAGDDSLAFLLLRHTGFRGSDAVKVTWRESTSTAARLSA